MKYWMAVLLAAGCFGADRIVASRFTYVDVMIDPKGKGLSAYQFEFTAETGNVSLVGIEGAEQGAYAARAPYYDPAALAGKRIVIGDYSLAADLPKVRTRVARVMLEVRGEEKPQFVAKLMAAADADGKTIAADLSIQEKQ